MKILLLGKDGQVGWEAQRSLSCLGEVIALGHNDFDLGVPASLSQIVAEYQPHVIVNAAAYTAVDQAETNIQQAHLVNAVSPGILANLARRQKAVFIHFSTDYVFDGQKTMPYVETDYPDPINVYGRTKLEGEEAVTLEGGAYMILRTGWVYSLRRDSFVSKVLKWSRERDMIRVVRDQVGSPTWARMLAEVCAQTLAKGGDNLYDWLSERCGLYHLAGSGSTSRYEWARSIFELIQSKGAREGVQILPASSDEFPAPARRPLMSALDCSKFVSVFGLALPDWRTALKLAMEESWDR